MEKYPIFSIQLEFEALWLHLSDTQPLMQPHHQDFLARIKGFVW